MEIMVLDSHTHCGLTVPFHNLESEWRMGGIHGGVVFSPVEEIYDRYDPLFVDSREYRRSRSQVHEYLLRITEREHVYPYFFVWNDFSPIPREFRGIKWHRHSSEPVYAYHTPRCDRTIDEICRRRLPIVLEEEFENTLKFLAMVGERTVVIIPHMGGLNGGYSRLREAGVFAYPNVWVDTALAHETEIADFADRYGTERILFGSDYPFGVPSHEKRKIERLFSEDDLCSILSGNLAQLLGCEDCL